MPHPIPHGCIATKHDLHAGRSVCFKFLAAIRKHGLPANWTAYRFEMLEDREPFNTLRLTGGVFLTTYQSGPRKGRPNYRKPEPGTARAVILTLDDVQAEVERYRVETGRCPECYGTGMESRGFGPEGTYYRRCKCGTPVPPDVRALIDGPAEIQGQLVTTAGGA
jgi:hypothetical protein